MILKIPYVSQKDPTTAGYSFNDCGPACVAMLLQAQNKFVTVDQIYKESNVTSKGPLSVSTLIKMASVFGLSLETDNDLCLDSLKLKILEGKPSIVLLNYKPIMEADLHESIINGWHFSLIVGFGKYGFFVHDPYWVEGSYRYWPYVIFKKAWINHTMIYPVENLAVEEISLNEPNFALVNVHNLNVRSGPGLEYSILKTLPIKTFVEVLSKTGRWLKIKHKNTTGYIASWLTTIYGTPSEE